MYHVVLATRRGRRILRGGIGEYLRISLKLFDRNCPEIRIFEANTNDNYLLMLISVTPKIAVEQAVYIIKRNTEKALSEKFRFLKRIFKIGGGIWSIGCLVSTVEISEEIIQKYIKYQKDEDCGQLRFEF